VATALALLGLALGGSVWLERQEAERRAETARQEERESQAVMALLKQAADLLKEGRWPEARTALEGAPMLLTSTQADLGGQLQQARADVNMVGKLEEIRLRLSENRRTHEIVSPEQLYAEAFRNYGIDVLTLQPAEAAERVRNSAIRETLLAFLHDWLYWASDTNRDKLRDVLDRADVDEWRREFREALAKKDSKKLLDLAKTVAAVQPPVVLSGLGGILLVGGHRDVALVLLRQAHQRYPADFWINLLLGLYWETERPQRSAGYYQAAVAIRPTSDQAYAGLGRALFAIGDAQEAVVAFRTAIKLNANSAVGKDMARALALRGSLKEARVSWKTSLERDPPDHESWHGYAELCLFLGHEQEYRWARQALLKRFGETKNDWVLAERTSLSCLLRPAPGDELRRAVKLVALAVAAGDRSTSRGNPYLRFVQGLAEYRQGHLKQAVPFLRESAEQLPNRPAPRLVLAMAQFQSGSTTEARKTLSAAVRAYNWSESTSASQTDTPVVWTSHVLRREAEAMILRNLPAFLQGDYWPQDNDERLALLGICQFELRYSAAARLYADAFATDPHLADNLTAECLRRTRGYEHPGDPIEAFNAACRYSAARCAARAGCGLGKDGAQLSGAERSRWRAQAREWLRADLAAWTKMLDSESGANRELAKNMINHWQVDPDLAGLREPRSLEVLPPKEQKECLELWKEIGTLLNRGQKTK
jgi:serine/threonine-protein kinase